MTRGRKPISALDRLRATTWSSNVMIFTGKKSKRSAAAAIGMINPTEDRSDHFQKISRGTRLPDNILFRCQEISEVYLTGPMGLPLWAAFEGKYPDPEIETTNGYEYIRYHDHSNDSSYIDEFENARESLSISREFFNKNCAHTNIINLTISIADIHNFIHLYGQWYRILNLWEHQHKALEHSLNAATKDLRSFCIERDKICELIYENHPEEIIEIFRYVMRKRYNIYDNDPFSNKIVDFDLEWLSRPSAWYAMLEQELGAGATNST